MIRKYDNYSLANEEKFKAPVKAELDVHCHQVDLFIGQAKTVRDEFSARALLRQVIKYRKEANYRLKDERLTKLVNSLSGALLIFEKGKPISERRRF